MIVTESEKNSRIARIAFGGGKPARWVDPPRRARAMAKVGALLRPAFQGCVAHRWDRVPEPRAPAVRNGPLDLAGAEGGSSRMGWAGPRGPQTLHPRIGSPSGHLPLPAWLPALLHKVPGPCWASCSPGPPPLLPSSSPPRNLLSISSSVLVASAGVRPLGSVPPFPRDLSDGWYWNLPLLSSVE